MGIRSLMRIAVLLKDRCQPKRCNLQCINLRPEAFSFILAVLANPPKEKYSISKENSD